MSRYGVDKLLREVMLSDEARDSFLADPRKYVEGRELSQLEHAAILERDYPALYDAGAHPFLLNIFVIRLLRSGDVFQHIKAYVATLEGHGHPDFST